MEKMTEHVDHGVKHLHQDATLAILPIFHQFASVYQPSK